MENNIKVQTIGHYIVTESTQKVMEDTIIKTADNDGVILNIA